MADLFLPEDQAVDGRLGLRFPGHDERNKNYSVRPLLANRRDAIVRKPTFWKLPANNSVFPLDQAKEGACGPFSASHELAVGPIEVSGINNDFAFSLYPRVQAMDRSMGNNWPDGVSMLALAKTLKAENRITAYRWAFGINDVLDTLISTGPVTIGVEWRYNMYFTASGGRVVLSGNVVGGHALTLVAYDIVDSQEKADRLKLPLGTEIVGWINSWGRGYGVADARLNAPGGIGWITVADLAALLARNGEALVPTDFFAASPPPPAPDPAKAPYFATARGITFHDRHPGLDRNRVFFTRDEALRAGLRPCGICRP
jgi:hypothetical protein